jgi:hypothetical protein
MHGKTKWREIGSGVICFSRLKSLASRWCGTKLRLCGYKHWLLAALLLFSVSAKASVHAAIPIRVNYSRIILFSGIGEDESLFCVPDMSKYVPISYLPYKIITAHPTVQKPHPFFINWTWFPTNRIKATVWGEHNPVNNITETSEKLF